MRFLFFSSSSFDAVSGRLRLCHKVLESFPIKLWKFCSRMCAYNFNCFAVFNSILVPTGPYEPCECRRDVIYMLEFSIRSVQSTLFDWYMSDAHNSTYYIYSIIITIITIISLEQETKPFGSKWTETLSFRCFILSNKNWFVRAPEHIVPLLIKMRKLNCNLRHQRWLSHIQNAAYFFYPVFFGCRDAYFIYLWAADNV